MFSTPFLSQKIQLEMQSDAVGHKMFDGEELPGTKRQSVADLRNDIDSLESHIVVLEVEYPLLREAVTNLERQFDRLIQSAQHQRVVMDEMQQDVRNLEETILKLEHSQACRNLMGLFIKTIEERICRFVTGKALESFVTWNGFLRSRKKKQYRVKYLELLDSLQMNEDVWDILDELSMASNIHAVSTEYDLEVTSASIKDAVSSAHIYPWLANDIFKLVDWNEKYRETGPVLLPILYY